MLPDRPNICPLHRVAPVLSVALGQRDLHTRQHSDRVIQLAVALGEQIGLSSHELGVLSLGAQFHDLGKIGIPDHILRKPAAFEQDEWTCMQQHAAIGERIILAMEGEDTADVARTVRHHHERFDGSGYPDRLAGDAIPLYARIISLADSYDAMLETRPYHRQRSHREVMDILTQENGSKHDPDLLYAFTAIAEKFADGDRPN